MATFQPGTDAMLYAASARAWLNGADPWQVTELGVRFAGPPPTLLLFAPFAYLAPVLTAVIWLVADVVAVWFVVRRLRIPWWWYLFPPILEAILPANPEPVVLACLVAAPSMVQAVAPVLKIYALAPLVGERRIKALAVSLTIIGASAVVLPWGRFLGDLPLVSSTLVDQTMSLSAWSLPWLLPFTVIGLLGLGLKRAGWLAVPALWPTHRSTTPRQLSR